MINLEFTQQQVDELKIYYNTELDKILKRANEIKEIIAKFDGKQETTMTPVVIEKKTTLISKEKNENIKSQKVEVDKQSRSSMILDILLRKNKPMTIREIVKGLNPQLNISPKELKKSYNHVEQNLFKLRKVENKVRSIKKDGAREKLYGLIEWNNKPSKQNKPLQEEKQKNDIKTTARLSKKTTPLRIQNKELPVITYNEWANIVTGLLNKEQKLLQAKDFLPAAIKYYNVSDNRKKEIRNRLSPILTRLIRDDKTKTIKKDKINGRLYGLPEWFDKNGELKSTFNEETKNIKNEKNTKQSRGKSVWLAFILDTIKGHNKILSAKHIVDLAMDKFKISNEKYTQIRVLLANNISSLENKKGIIKSSKIKGDRANYYGLSEWFNENGNLKSEYKTDV